MPNLVVPSNGGSETDHVMRTASDFAGEDGTVVAISVLAGSFVDKGLPPPEAGRRRRAAEDEAERKLLVQAARARVDCRVIALFGHVVFDTLLLACNLDADAVVMAMDDPELARMLEQSPIPVVAVPRSG